MDSLLDQLITALRCLPGVGPRTAQRMAVYLLEQDRVRGQHLSHIMDRAMREVGYCDHCRILSEHPRCEICSSTRRDPTQLCVVESPSDVFAIEQTHRYQGYYFVLRGHLSPLDGIGPQEIGVEQLSQRLNQTPLQEVILATNHTVEGHATAHYLTELIKPLKIKVSRLAQGIPAGGELEFIDSRTLAEALVLRTCL